MCYYELKGFFLFTKWTLIFPCLLAKSLYSWIWNQDILWSSNIFRFGCLDVCYLTNLHKIPLVSPFCVWPWMVGPCSANPSAQAVICILRVCRCIKIFNEKHKIVLKWFFIKIMSLWLVRGDFPAVILSGLHARHLLLGTFTLLSAL